MNANNVSMACVIKLPIFGKCEMLQKELDALASQNPERFFVDYAVDKASSSLTTSTKDFSFKTGLVNGEMLQQTFGKLPEKPELVFICGPMGFHEAVRNILLGSLGYIEDQIFDF